MKSLLLIDDVISSEIKKNSLIVPSEKNCFFEKDFVHSIISGKENVLVSGFSGTGKTTLLKEILNYTPKMKWLVVCQNKEEKEFFLKTIKNKNCKIKSWFDLAFEEIKQKKQWVNKPSKKIAEKVFGVEYRYFKLSWHLAVEFCSSKEERIESFLNKKTNFNEEIKNQTLEIWNYWNNGDEGSFAPFDWIIKAASLRKKTFYYDGVLIDDFQETTNEKFNLLFSKNFGLSVKKIVVFEDKMKNLINFDNSEKADLASFRKISLKESHDISIDLVEKLNFLIKKSGIEEKLIASKKEKLKDLSCEEVILNLENVKNFKNKRFKKVFFKNEEQAKERLNNTKKISNLYVALSRSKNIVIDEETKDFIDKFFKEIDKSLHDDGF